MGEVVTPDWKVRALRGPESLECQTWTDSDISIPQVRQPSILC
jgi:hypothetical protein